MSAPMARLISAARVLGRPGAVAIVAACAQPQTFSILGARVGLTGDGVRATLEALLDIGAVAKPEGAYLAPALEQGQLRCTIPALLRGLADEIEVLP